ncbi:MAG: hypothetical protein II613_05215 [Bacteroidales bacterium]|nr:hypothetical protein [Bacteroidales bacterium]
MYNYGITATDFNYANKSHSQYDVHGAGLKLSYDSFIGPLSIQLHWSSLWHRTEVYVNAGYIF